MQVSTFSVMSKKITYLESYIMTDDVQCIFFSKVPGNRSIKPSNSLARFTLSHTRTWQPHVFPNQMRSISCCRRVAYGIYSRVSFWKHVRIGSRFAFAMAKETEYNWGMTYQSVNYRYNRKETLFIKLCST